MMMMPLMFGGKRGVGRVSGMVKLDDERFGPNSRRKEET